MGAAMGWDNAGVRVGIDVVSVSEVEAAAARFGDRYEQALFTEDERGDAPPAGRSRAEALAARFAAKEAAIKVLRPAPGGEPRWRDVEVARHPHGWCQIRLRGRAASLAQQAGLRGWSVSLTHHADMAAAVVAAVEEPGAWTT
jgi:holo-[acyl-carrier protein] synthase